MEFVFVEPGTFTMGSDSKDAFDDETPHPVTLTQGFWLGVYEVTQAEWEAVMAENPSDFQDPLSPVETVSWEDIVGTEENQGFLAKLNALAPLPEGWVYALPTEAQWEYACRAGTTTEYAFGDELRPDQANFSSSAIGETIAVGRYEPNAWGLYDMHGNVYEWVQDWKGDYETGADGQPVVDPAGPPSGSFRVLRGGCWVSYAGYCRSAFRGRGSPGNANDDLGFRLAAVPSSNPPGGTPPRAERAARKLPTPRTSSFLTDGLCAFRGSAGGRCGSLALRRLDILVRP